LKKTNALLIAALGAGFLAAPLSAQTAAAVAAPATLSIDEAVASALAKDPGVISANLDWLSASAKADSSSWKRFPSLSASAGYQRISDVTSSIDLGKGIPPITLGSLDNLFSFGLNLQYPVFAGFRVKESIAIAGLQAQAKDIARETVKRSLAFDVRRAYWEAVRSTYNRSTLEQNLELMKLNSEFAKEQLGQGVATRADQLAAQMRLEQANEDLGDAQSLQRRAFLSLASLTGQDIASLGIGAASLDAPLPFELTTKPEAASPQAASPATPALDEAALVSGALARRPETRGAELARKLAEHAVELSRAALYPTVAVTGNFTYADPNQRVAFQTDPWEFTGTWAVGLQISYDIGGVPAALDDIKAQGLAASKAKADEARQRNAVAMDVETCIVNLARARRDLGSTQAMVEQAKENLRVMQDKVSAGSAKALDLSSSKFDLLRFDFAVTNKRIDALIAQADLERATAFEEAK
jgi:outer membrane protein TolC